MIRFERARFADVEAEIAPLWEANWREVSPDQERVPLDPDWAKYRALDLGGFLEVTTARRSGVLVGYSISTVDGHLHHRSTLFAMQDLRYLRPDCRGGRTAMRMSQAHEVQLRARGVAVMLTAVAEGADRDGRLLRRLGWAPAETIYSKGL